MGSNMPSSSSSSKYRYSVGTQVLCRTGPEEWSVGTIVQLDYRESDWPAGRTVPYQVQLEDGPLIFVPKDVQMLCVKLTPPWWAAILDGPGSRFAQNPAATELQAACADQDVNKRNHKGLTALMEAVRLNWPAGVEALIQMGAKVNMVDKSNASALHRGYIYGAPMISLLLKARADPNLQDNDPDFDPEFTSTTFGDRLQHRTPLHYCCLEGDLESAKLLVQGNADLDLQDAQFKSPLHLAIEEGNDHVIDFLLEAGAVPDLCSIESGMKNSPLMDAAMSGKLALAEKLIRAGADVNKVGKQDMTALHLAARRGDASMAKVLLDARADATLESKIGSALSLAKTKGSVELLKLFGAEKDASQPGAKRPHLDDALRAALYMT
eukprot:gb/GFBE01016888.1/.p1 GENE.gb/GFBE01016888.1/~~gb/GFBE01016888.1/.p1  ORF type:complete len:381 (+),score=89.32 gb/GFBE01016888.1/:1-1143(+)